MRTKNHLDIDEAIERRRKALERAGNDLDRHLFKGLLAEAIVERAAAMAEMRTSPDWDRVPF